MTTDKIRVESVDSELKRVMASNTWNLDATATIPIAIAWPINWTLNQLVIQSNQPSCDITFSILKNGVAITGYSALDLNGNTKSTVTVDADILTTDTLEIDITDVTSTPGLLSAALIGEIA